MFLSPALNWPIAVVVCISVGLAGVLVLYLIVRIRSNKRQHNPTINTGDDLHSQMEWEDDIGLNITVNPLDETKKPIQLTNIEKANNGYHGSSSDDEDENDGRNHNEYSSEDDDAYENGQAHPRKLDHQLEWDDAAIEYAPKKV